MRFSFDRCSAEEAKLFWEGNAEARAFNNPDVLESLAPTVDWWCLSKGSETFAVWPIPLEKSGKVHIPDSLTLLDHFGPTSLFLARLPPDLRIYSRGLN